jgi:hypothetical protein
VGLPGFRIALVERDVIGHNAAVPFG